MSDAGHAVSTDSLGGIILAGTYQGESEFFGGQQTLTGFGLNDVFIARYDYQIQSPATRFEVSVSAHRDHPSQIHAETVFTLNGLRNPDLEIIEGLDYEFVLDGNSTREFPFFFTSKNHR